MASSSGFNSNKEENVFNLYSINVRSESINVAPELCIRKLSSTDNIMVIENQNRLLREFIARRNEIIYMDSNMSALQRHTWLANVQIIPEFKYVYCTQAMIR